MPLIINNPSNKILITLQVVLKNNKTSLSTRVGAGVSEVFLKLNPRDLSSHYLVSVAPVTLEGPGTFCPPVNLSLPADLLPISVQVSLHIDVCEADL